MVLAYRKRDRCEVGGGMGEGSLVMKCSGEASSKPNCIIRFYRCRIAQLLLLS